MVAPSLYKLSIKKRAKLSSDQPLQLIFTQISPSKQLARSAIITEVKPNELRLHLPTINASPRPESSTRRSQSLSKSRKEEESPSLLPLPSTSPLPKIRTKTPEYKRPKMPQFLSTTEKKYESVPISSAKTLILEPVYSGASPVVLFDYPPQCFKDSRVNDRVKGSNDFKLFFHVSSNVHTYNSVVNAFLFAGFTQNEKKFNVLISGVPKVEVIRELNSFQKVNHFPASKQLGRKDNLWKNVNGMRRKFPKEFEICPKTYLLPEDFDVLAAQISEKKKIWIVKPAAASCGRGIKVIKSIQDLPKKGRFVVSKYISKPHTINGFKYDLRVYVCVTGFDPLRIFVYKDGLVRFATEQYVKGKKSLKKRYIHLTNFSVNKKSKNFIKVQNDTQDGEGSKWSFSALRKKFIDLNLDFDSVSLKIEEIIIKTLISVESHMISSLSSQKYRNTCFELYGFDILIDEDLKPWLLEVNILPSLSSSSPMDKKIKTSLMCDILTLIGIKPFKPEEEPEKAKNIYRNLSSLQSCNSLDDYVLSEDDLQILFDCEEENYRQGSFKKVFPLRKNIDIYSKFFSVPRYNNLLLWKHLKSGSNVISKYFKRQHSTTNI
jgi:tubulin polyglutamylase TTLL4